jgi:hypothetical protein
MHLLKKVVVALAVAFPMAAMAQSPTELQAELEALKAHVARLETRIEQASAKAEAASAQVEQASANAVDLTEFNRIRIKTEAMEDAAEESGMKALKISGYVDPTYIYNRNAKTSSFVFLNNNSSINGSEEGFYYDNTYFGSAMINLHKELEGGTLFTLSLMPSKGTASGYNFGNLVHEASVSVPLGDLQTRLIAGQIPDWAGYEYIASTMNPLITHNLLFDFSAASFYTGVGVHLTRGNWDTKVMLGNLNSARINTPGERSPGLFYRGDYYMGEYSGFGFSGVHSGFDDDTTFGRLDLLEVDGYFTRGDWNFSGQIIVGQQQATPYNEYTIDKQRWWGLSGLASYKLTPRLESIARLDYIDNTRGGGGLFGSTYGGTCLDLGGDDAFCPDGQNGFGSSMVFDGSDWVVQDPSRGTKRAALSLGLNYALMPGVNIKGEYRLDRSDGNVFQTADGQYRKNNHVLGVSTVVGF